jgi:uncharacterized membrane protein YgcG
VKFAFSRRSAAIAAVSACVLVPLGVFGAPALARSASAASEYGNSGSSQYQYKVQVCHRTHSKKHPWHVISVSSAAVQAHLNHGDTLAPPCPPTSPPPAPVHGNSGHGNSGGNQGESGNDTSGGHGNSGSHGNSGQHGNSGSHGNGNGHGK